MLDKIEKLSKILNENNSEKSLRESLGDFFDKNFSTGGFSINTIENSQGLRYKYPLIKDNKSIGFLEYKNETSGLKNFLDVTAQFISLKLQNLILNERMQQDMYFQNTMKDIAKIIENQYELNYIIPLIGEMTDKFFPDYLTYLFLNNAKIGESILAWPGACNDKKILEMLQNKIEVQSSEDGKIYTVPLIYENDYVGILAAKSTSDVISEKDKNYLKQLAVQIAITIHRANSYIEILKYATIDALTGFYNRRQLENRIKQEVASAKRQHTPLCGIMTDIDYFKKVNDNYGHAVGDLVLKEVAKTIRSQLREYDIAGRYGGEEFSIILPFTNIKEANMAAERLRNAVEKRIIDISKVNPDAGTKKISVTMSLGIYEIKETDSDDDLLKKADKALYVAKNSGRNKVVVNED